MDSLKYYEGSETMSINFSANVKLGRVIPKDQSGKCGILVIKQVSLVD